MAELQHVIVYTDGGCSGNPGPGGYATVLLCEGRRKVLSGGRRLTTNNRMEILAAIVALEALKFRCRVTVRSDSKYLVDAMQQGWAAKWRANGWKRNRKERAENPDLWERLLELASGHEVVFEWVRGHDGDPENEFCDRAAVEPSGQRICPRTRSTNGTSSQWWRRRYSGARTPDNPSGRGL